VSFVPFCDLNSNLDFCAFLWLPCQIFADGGVCLVRSHQIGALSNEDLAARQYADAQSGATFLAKV
jgi:hypothetical protein